MLSYKTFLKKKRDKIHSWITEQVISHHLTGINLPSYECGCAIANYLLFRNLTQTNISSGYHFSLAEHPHEHQSHVYIEDINKNTIIDMAALQFSSGFLSGGLYVNEIDNTSEWYYTPSWSSKNYDAQELKIKLKNWPTEQNPFRALKKVPLGELQQILSNEVITEDLL